MSKAIEENNLTVINILYENSICKGNLCVKTKIMIRKKPAAPFHSSYSFLNC